MTLVTTLWFTSAICAIYGYPIFSCDDDVVFLVCKIASP